MRKKLNYRNILFALITLFLIIFCILMIFKIAESKKDKKDKKNKVTTSEKKSEKKKVGEEPVIKLNGIEEYRLVKNGVYEELGATAEDKEDGDLSDKVKIDNKIDNTKPGEYVVKYTVSDKDGNKVTKNRKVTVFEVDNKDTDGIAVLMYHYFYDDTAGEEGETSNYMAKSLFEEQLKYLSENNYYFPNMKEINLYLDGKLDLPEKSIVLTLDDGEASNYSIAYPLAVKYKVPIVMFVVTSWTDITMPLQKEMKNTGYVIFHSHTDNMHEGGCGEQHGARILCIDHDSGVEDLKTSAEKIGNSDAMAYPCGDTNDNAKQILTDAGYVLGFTTAYGKIKIGDEKLALPRVRMNDGISLDSFIDSI